MSKPTMAEVIAEVVRNFTGECICDGAFTSRGREDPDCTYHRVPSKEVATDATMALKAHGFGRIS